MQSVIEHLPSMHKALGPTSSTAITIITTTKQGKKKLSICLPEQFYYVTV